MSWLRSRLLVNLVGLLSRTRTVRQLWRNGIFSNDRGVVRQSRSGRVAADRDRQSVPLSITVDVGSGTSPCGNIGKGLIEIGLGDIRRCPDRSCKIRPRDGKRG